MDRVRVVDPRGVRRDDGAAIDVAPRPRTLAGLRLGLLDNGKPNAREALAAIGAALSAEHAMVATAVTKPVSSRACPDELLERLKDADVALVGVGD